MLILLLGFLPTFAQTEASFRVMWYNVENTFDINDDPSTEDNEFLPKGNRRWTPKRYYYKLRQLARVITAAGEWDTPALVGLCEVENDSVISHLINRTPLRRQQYRYCLGGSSDPRGIRIALLYQRDRFAYLGHTSIPVWRGERHQKPTRDILHVWGKVTPSDTLDILLCHFPSRYGGEKETEKKRMEAARILRSICDSLHAQRATPQLVLMGDFNDEPNDKSMREVLQAIPLPEQLPATSKDSLTLYNLFADNNRLLYPGSHKYQGEWSQLDQIIVSANLVDHSSSMHLRVGSVRLFAPPFLLTEDKTWRGVRPKRTYYGYTYEGGFSDHLPLLTDWIIRLPNRTK